MNIKEIILLKSSFFTPSLSKTTATARAPAAIITTLAAASMTAASARSTSARNISCWRKLQRRPTTKRLTEWETDIKTNQSFKYFQNNHYSLLKKKWNDDNINQKKIFLLILIWLIFCFYFYLFASFLMNNKNLFDFQKSFISIFFLFYKSLQTSNPNQDTWISYSIIIFYHLNSLLPRQ